MTVLWKPVYNSKGWVLCRCKTCGRLNYVEPHGTTAPCRCSGGSLCEHENLPFSERDVSGTVYTGKR